MSCAWIIWQAKGQPLPTSPRTGTSQALRGLTGCLSMVSSQFDKVAHGRLTQRGNPWYGRQLLRATPPKNGAIFDTFF